MELTLAKVTRNLLMRDITTRTSDLVAWMVLRRQALTYQVLVTAGLDTSKRHKRTVFVVWSQSGVRVNMQSTFLKAYTTLDEAKAAMTAVGDTQLSLGYHNIVTTTAPMISDDLSLRVETFLMANPEFCPAFISIKDMVDDNPEEVFYETMVSGDDIRREAFWNKS